MKNITLIVLACMLVFLQETKSSSEVKVVITKQGLDYAANQAVNIMANSIKGSRIENQEGKSGSIEYGISDVIVTGFTKPSSNVVTTQNKGLTLSLSGGYISISGRWRYKFKKGFIKIRDSGSFTASADGISISLSASLGRDSRGAPTISSTGCSSSIKNVNFKLKGGASWLYNIFIKFYRNKARSTLEDKLCKSLVGAINNNGAKQLATLNLKAKVNDLLTLDYSLASPPVFGANFLETNHVGRFIGDNVDVQTPQMKTVTSRMVSISISENSLNGALRLLHANNKLTYSKEYPAKVVDKIISTIIGGKQNPYPGAKLQIKASASAIPFVSIQPGSTKLTASIEGIFDVVMDNNVKINILTIDLNIIFSMSVSLAGDRLVGSAISLTSTVSRISIPHASIEQINEGISQMTTLLLPTINNYLQHGLPLPNTAGVRFVNAVLSLNDRHLTVATDVTQ